MHQTRSSNTFLEELHAGGKNITQDEMKTLMKEVVNCLYEFFLNMDNEEFIEDKVAFAEGQTYMWDEPSLEELEELRNQRNPNRKKVFPA